MAAWQELKRFPVKENDIEDDEYSILKHEKDNVIYGISATGSIFKYCHDKNDWNEQHNYSKLPKDVFENLWLEAAIIDSDNNKIYFLNGKKSSMATLKLSNNDEESEWNVITDLMRIGTFATHS